MGAAFEASREQNGSLVERACGCFYLAMSGYASVGYRGHCAQATMERRLSSGKEERQCLYQRAMVTLFHDMIHHEVECYVDDMIEKSQTEEGHLADRGKSVDRLRRFKLRLNSNKCTIRVRAGCSPTETVYAGSYHFVDFRDGSDQPIPEEGPDPESERILMSDGEVKVNEFLLPGKHLSAPTRVADEVCILGIEPRCAYWGNAFLVGVWNEAVLPVEAANKNIKKIVQKMVVTYKDWHEMLPFALHGYRTSVRTSTGETPFSLVYGMEAVLPVEVQIPSLRVLMDVKLQEAEWVRTRYEELSLIEEKRLAAICHGQLYQQRMKRAFDKKVRPRVYHVGDMVLKRILPPQNDRRGKWTPNYEGPFVVKKVFSGGALLLTTMDGEDFPPPVNADAAKEGLKRTTASSTIVCALVKASWIMPGRDQSETSCSEGRKHGESEDIWGVTELELDEITGFTLPLG
ncbi:hypothetical protein KIW84_011090 [Lathyrus oleraceus]|uniref:Uncharacterized protein n=1 Tax=Pisum sativum TaxID=3888 RepID=A0A9D5BEI0_PEA|nr:hypothetical protein KIW84_011090 [Pisum sativum]